MSNNKGTLLHYKILIKVFGELTDFISTLDKFPKMKLDGVEEKWTKQFGLQYNIEKNMHFDSGGRSLHELKQVHEILTLLTWLTFEGEKRALKRDDVNKERIEYYGIKRKIKNGLNRWVDQYDKTLEEFEDEMKERKSKLRFKVVVLVGDKIDNKEKEKENISELIEARTTNISQTTIPEPEPEPDPSQQQTQLLTNPQSSSGVRPKGLVHLRRDVKKIVIKYELGFPSWVTDITQDDSGEIVIPTEIEDFFDKNDVYELPDMNVIRDQNSVVSEMRRVMEDYSPRIWKDVFKNLLWHYFIYGEENGMFLSNTYVNIASKNLRDITQTEYDLLEWFILAEPGWKYVKQNRQEPEFEPHQVIQAWKPLDSDWYPAVILSRDRAKYIFKIKYFDGIESIFIPTGVTEKLSPNIVKYLDKIGTTWKLKPHWEKWYENVQDEQNGIRWKLRDVPDQTDGESPPISTFTGETSKVNRGVLRYYGSRERDLNIIREDNDDDDDSWDESGDVENTGSGEIPDEDHPHRLTQTDLLTRDDSGRREIPVIRVYDEPFYEFDFDSEEDGDDEYPSGWNIESILDNHYYNFDQIGGTVDTLKKAFNLVRKGAKFIKDNKKTIAKGARAANRFRNEVGLGNKELKKIVDETKKFGVKRLEQKSRRYEIDTQRYGRKTAQIILRQRQIRDNRAWRYQEFARNQPRPPLFSFEPDGMQRPPPPYFPGYPPPRGYFPPVPPSGNGNGNGPSQYPYPYPYYPQYTPPDPSSYYRAPSAVKTEKDDEDDDDDDDDKEASAQEQLNRIRRRFVTDRSRIIRMRAQQESSKKRSEKLQKIQSLEEEQRKLKETIIQ